MSQFSHERNASLAGDFHAACRGVVEDIFRAPQDQVDAFNARFKVGETVRVVHTDGKLCPGAPTGPAYILDHKKMRVAVVEVACAHVTELYSLDRVLPAEPELQP